MATLSDIQVFGDFGTEITPEVKILALRMEVAYTKVALRKALRDLSVFERDYIVCDCGEVIHKSAARRNRCDDCHRDLMEARHN